MNISSKDILFRALRTPNPFAIKIVVNFPLKNQGKAEWAKSQKTEQDLGHKPKTSPPPLGQKETEQEGPSTSTPLPDPPPPPKLFSKLLNIETVKQVHVFENQITLNSEQALVDFEKISAQAEAIVRELGPSHNPDFSSPLDENKKRDQSQWTEKRKKAEEALDRAIRPGLQADGGDLEIVSFEGNRIEIAYQGACGGCPSSYMGTLDAVESILQKELNNEKIEVYPV